MTTALLSEVGRGEEGHEGTIPVVTLTPEGVGARIATAREEKGWSQFDLALALSVSPSTIYRWEKGRLPSVQELMRLAASLDKPGDYFTEPPERQTQLEDLRALLEEVRAESERAREAALEILLSIDARLSRIEARLELPDAQGNHP